MPAADAFQIQSVSRARFVTRMGSVSEASLEAIVRAAQVVVAAS